MNQNDLCWLAGWLEGEGCFLYGLHRGNSPRIIIQVFSTDLDVIQKAAKLMEAKTIRVIPPRKCTGTQWKSNGGYRTELQGEPAAILMLKLLPMMGERRSEKIKEALQKWDMRPSKPMEKQCACGCGRTLFGGRRMKYARRSGACAQRVYHAKSKMAA